VDETGQPGTEPAATYGNGANGSGLARGHANGWQPESNGSRRDAPHADAVRAGLLPQNGSLRTAEANWSNAGAALEPTTDQPPPAWRQPIASSLRGHPEASHPENGGFDDDPPENGRSENGRAENNRTDQGRPESGRPEIGRLPTRPRYAELMPPD
jgi:hypothetical protein